MRPKAALKAEVVGVVQLAEPEREPETEEQEVHEEAPSELKVPAGQFWQEVALTVLLKVPARQGEQEVAPAALNFPTGQLWQEVEPAVALEFPAGQSWQVPLEVP